MIKYNLPVGKEKQGMSKKRGKEEPTSDMDDCRLPAVRHLHRLEGGRPELEVLRQARNRSAGRKSKPFFGSCQVLGECISNKYYLK